MASTRLTHVIPVFTRENGRLRETACGLWILAHEHNSEPTCPLCHAWVMQEAANDAQTVDDVFGTPEAQS